MIDLKSLTIQPGDTIGIAAPSARFDIDRFNRGLEILKDMGFKTRIPRQVFQKKRYFAGEDIQRAQTVNALFEDREIQAILCARGGFGAMRMLPFLDWEIIKKNPKSVIGFSDATALLLNIWQKTGMPVIHGPTLLSLTQVDQASKEAFHEVLTGQKYKVPLKDARIRVPGKCKGKILGGNLATMSHLMGTDYLPRFEGKILFMEDVKEPAYKIDRMLSQMKLAGVFDGLAGVMTGDFSDCDLPGYVDEIIDEIFSDMDIPVLSGVPAGHGSTNHAFFMGVETVVDTELKQIRWL